jgi:hypothetical protein
LRCKTAEIVLVFAGKTAKDGGVGRQLDLLVPDELGYVPASKAGAELLFDVIATAYELSSVVLTTNLSLGHWTEVLGNDRLTGGHRPPHSPLPHYGDDSRELPAARREAPPPTGPPS